MGKFVVFVGVLSCCGTESENSAEIAPADENPQVIASQSDSTRDPVVRCAGPLEDGTEIRYEIRQLALGKFVAAAAGAGFESRHFVAANLTDSATPIIMPAGPALAMRLEKENGRAVLRVLRAHAPPETLQCQIQPSTHRVNSVNPN